MNTEKKENIITFRIDDKTKELLEKITKIKRRNKSDMIRIIIEDYVKQFEDINFTA